MIIAPVFRTNLPEGERLSAQQLVRDLKGAGQRARAACLDRRHRRDDRQRREAHGDLVVFMSNGGFGGMHQKTLQALRG